MLDYIKQQLAAQHPVATFSESNVEEENDNLVMEYAHIFQELDDISVEGEDAHRARALELDIPIENDVELDTVELNLMDNRLMDVPMDVTAVTEHFNEAMKTYDDFYQEACNAIQPFMREDQYNLAERRHAYAKRNYDIYHEQMVQEGMFGFDKFPITRNDVPTNIMRDFGPLNPNDDQHYMVKLPVSFEVDANQNIMQSQLDALRVSKTTNIFEQFADVLAEKVGTDRVWDIVTPKRVIVPTPKDNYEVIVEFECDGMDQPIYEGWTYSRKPSMRDKDITLYPHDSITKMVSEMHVMNKRDYVKPVDPDYVVPSRWEQEAAVKQTGFYKDNAQKNSIKATLLGGAIGTGVAALAALATGNPVTLLLLYGGYAAGVSVGSKASQLYLKKHFNDIATKNLIKSIKNVLDKFVKWLREFDPDSFNAKQIKKDIENLKIAIDKLRDDLHVISIDSNYIRYHEKEFDKAFLHRVIDQMNKCEDAAREVSSIVDKSLDITGENFITALIDPANKKYLTALIDNLEKLLKMLTTEEDTGIKLESFIDYSNDDIYQEAIDFGYPDETTESAKQNQPSVNSAPSNDPSAPTVNADADASQDPDAATPPPEDGGNADNMDQPPVEGDPNAQPPTDDANADNKIQIDTNDVSDQIVDKVADELNADNNPDTNAGGADANGDINIDDNSTNTDDMSQTSSDDAFGNIDTSLDDLDNTNTSVGDDTAMGDPANMDINSMSIDDIMAQAAEKLKSMPIEQVKQFLTDGTGGMDASSSDTDLQQESFFLTKNNIRGEIDARLKKCLGDLNDNTKTLNEIIKAFKTSGKQLNKALTKGIKMKGAFNDEEVFHLNKLNSALVRLQTGLQPTASTEETNAVKALIHAFTSEAEIVGKFVGNSSGKVGVTNG